MNSFKRWFRRTFGHQCYACGQVRLLPWQRVAANVEVGVSQAPSGDDRRRLAMEALDQVGLSGREQEWPAILSGGQKQRVALARALVSHPQLLALFYLHQQLVLE